MYPPNLSLCYQITTDTRPHMHTFIYFHMLTWSRILVFGATRQRWVICDRHVCRTRITQLSLYTRILFCFTDYFGILISMSEMVENIHRLQLLLNRTYIEFSLVGL